MVLIKLIGALLYGDVSRSTNAPIVCLQETKVAIMNQSLFLSVFGTAYDKFVAFTSQWHQGGGVLIAWKSDMCQVISSRADVFFSFCAVC